MSRKIFEILIKLDTDKCGDEFGEYIQVLTTEQAKDYILSGIRDALSVWGVFSEDVKLEKFTESELTSEEGNKEIFANYAYMETD